MLTKILFFLAGIVGAQQFTALPGLAWLCALGLAGAVFGLRRYWRLAAFCYGLFWALSAATIRLADRLPERLAGQDLSIEGYVAELPEINPDHVRFNFKITKARPDIPGKIRLTWYHPQQTLKAGQSWRLTVRLKPPYGNLNPGGFDYERWLFVQDIGATGYVRAEPLPVLLTFATSIEFALLTLRQLLADRIDRLEVSPASKGMIKALTIGDGSGLSSEQWEIFRRTGTTHLMVISGSHVALVAGLVYLLTLRLFSRYQLSNWPPQQPAAFLAVLTAFGYAGLTGFAVPAQRAALMLTVAMLALWRQRHSTSFHTLGVALLTVLLIDPLVVLLPGFWLSFLAVSLIIYVLAGRLSKPGYWFSLLKINWATAIGLSPLILYFFQQVPLVTPAANLLAVPVIGLLVVPLALVATLVLLTLPGFGETLFHLVDYCLQGFWWFLLQLADLPFSTFSQMSPGFWALIFAVPAVLILLAPKGVPARWLGVVLLLPMLVTVNRKPDVGDAELTLLDVGQGLSAVVQTANHVLVYDTGAKFSETSDAGQSIIMPYLRSQGIARIDTLVVSHGDNDHIGGAGSLLRQYETGRILTSVPQLLAGYSPQPCQAGQSWQWDGVDFTVLSPEHGISASDNNNSCVLQIRGRQGSILLPGDIEGEAESRLVGIYGEELKSDVLLAPHHGSETSSTTAFLHAVAPELILIPAGYRNQFGHPHHHVLQVYKALKKTWLVSAEQGAVKVRLTSPLQVESWRDSEGRYWNYRYSEKW